MKAPFPENHSTPREVKDVGTLMPTYEIITVADLLHVPEERRYAACRALAAWLIDMAPRHSPGRSTGWFTAHLYLGSWLHLWTGAEMPAFVWEDHGTGFLRESNAGSLARNISTQFKEGQPWELEQFLEAAMGWKIEVTALRAEVADALYQVQNVAASGFRGTGYMKPKVPASALSELKATVTIDAEEAIKLIRRALATVVDSGGLPASVLDAFDAAWNRAQAPGRESAEQERCLKAIEGLVVEYGLKVDVQDTVTYYTAPAKLADLKQAPRVTATRAKRASEVLQHLEGWLHYHANSLDTISAMRLTLASRPEQWRVEFDAPKNPSDLGIYCLRSDATPNHVLNESILGGPLMANKFAAFQEAIKAVNSYEVDRFNDKIRPPLGSVMDDPDTPPVARYMGGWTDGARGAQLHPETTGEHAEMYLRGHRHGAAAREQSAKLAQWAMQTGGDESAVDAANAGLAARLDAKVRQIIIDEARRNTPLRPQMSPTDGGDMLLAASEGKPMVGQDGLTWPQTMDAAAWATMFAQTIKEHPGIPTDEGAMLGWFANAIMAGYDTAARRAKEVELAGQEIVVLKSADKAADHDLPAWQCHKVVRAAKIGHIAEKPNHPDGRWWMYLVDAVCAKLATYPVDHEWYKKHNPVAGGYYIEYSDGYTGFSPALPFEQGYKMLVPGQKTPLDHIRNFVAIQSNSGNWDYAPYMLGMFNGLELALATMEDREPDYRKAPESGWLEDKPRSKAFPTPDQLPVPAVAAGMDADQFTKMVSQRTNLPVEDDAVDGAGKVASTVAPLTFGSPNSKATLAHWMRCTADWTLNEWKIKVGDAIELDRADFETRIVMVIVERNRFNGASSVGVPVDELLAHAEVMAIEDATRLQKAKENLASLASAEPPKISGRMLVTKEWELVPALADDGMGGKQPAYSVHPGSIVDLKDWNAEHALTTLGLKLPINELLAHARPATSAESKAWDVVDGALPPSEAQHATLEKIVTGKPVESDRIVITGPGGITLTGPAPNKGRDLGTEGYFNSSDVAPPAVEPPADSKGHEAIDALEKANPAAPGLVGADAPGVPVYIGNILGHFARFAILQSPYMRPEGLEEVLAAIDGDIQDRFSPNGIATLNLREIENMLNEAIMALPQVSAWNQRGNGSSSEFINGTGQRNPHNEFIDLQALIGNTAQACIDEATHPAGRALVASLQPSQDHPGGTIGLWRYSPDVKGTKYLVLRRDGSVPEWPWFIMGARDEAAVHAVAAYAWYASLLGYPAQFVADMERLAREMAAYRQTHGAGDPTAPPDREDCPAIITLMEANARGESARIMDVPNWIPNDP